MTTTFAIAMKRKNLLLGFYQLGEHLKKVTNGTALWRDVTKKHELVRNLHYGFGVCPLRSVMTGLFRGTRVLLWQNVTHGKAFCLEEGRVMTGQKAQVWVVDDDAEMRSMLSDFLQTLGYQVSTFPRADEAETYLSKMNPENPPVDLIISDLRMPGMSGLEFLDALSNRGVAVPLVLMTAFGSIETAIEAMRKGAYDYIVKPLKLAELKVVAERALEFRQLKRDNKILRDQVSRTRTFEGILGKSKKMQAVFDIISRVAQTSANVLVTGESGTGKEMVARALHETSQRAKAPFVAINCSAIPENLLESELFGHAKGAFTGAIQQKIGLFEAANGGTLFLDEIGDMNIDLQAKLLRVIQERKVRPIGETRDREIDVRIVAATHKDLKAATKTGSFREDLYYRLAVIPVVLPPLREREDDILILGEFFLKKYSALHGIRKNGFSKDAIQSLYRRRWPGNVRELENAIERAVILGHSNLIESADLPHADEETADGFFSAMKNALPPLEELEREYIKFVLEKTGGHKEKAAQILGINRRTLYRKDLGEEFSQKQEHE